MLPRSAGKPIFIGLGAAAIIAAGTAQVQAAPDEGEPALQVTVSTGAEEVKAGTTVSVTARVTAVNEAAKLVKVLSVKATASGAEPTLTGECVNGCPVADTLPVGDPKVMPGVAKVTVPEDIEKATTVTVTVLVDSDTTDADNGLTSITYTPLKTPSPSPTPTPTPTKTKTPTKPPKPSPTPTKSSPAKDDDDDEGTGSGSGSSGSGSGSGSSGSGSGYTPPSPNGSFGTPGAQNPRVALPPIAPPSPSVAPQATPSPESRLRNNKAPVAQDLTFERMASTQVAWLAALMVAFSLLITQLRLGRRHGRPASARALAASRHRSKGGHRRPRRGLFGK